jgi:AAA domain
MEYTQARNRTNYASGNGSSPNGERPPEWPKLIELNDFLKTEIPEPKSIVAGVFDAGTVVLFGGSVKSFKTWLQLDLAICIATGTLWLGFPVTKQVVIFVNFEVREYYLQRRIDAILKAKGLTVPLDNLFVWNLRDIGKFHRAELINSLKEKCQSKKCQMTFIDPYYRLLEDHEKEENQADMRKALNDLHPLYKEGVSVSCGIHFSKGNQSGKEPEDRISGAGTIIRYPDTVITVTKHQEPGCFTINMRLRDMSEPDPFVVEWRHPVMVRRKDLDPEDLKKPQGNAEKYDRAKLYEFISAHDGEFTKAQLIKPFMEYSGCSRKTAYRMIDELITKKRVVASKITDKISINPAYKATV